MKFIIGSILVFTTSLSVSAETAIPIDTKEHCWYDSKANSVGAVLKVENDKKILRCSKVLIIDKHGNANKITGWVEAEISSKENPRLLTFKEN